MSAGFSEFDFQIAETGCRIERGVHGVDFGFDVAIRGAHVCGGSSADVKPVRNRTARGATPDGL